MSQTPITLLEASEADLSTLVVINRLAYKPDLMSRFMFTTWPAPSAAIPFLTQRLRDKIESINSNLIKAVDTTTNEIVGLISYELKSPENETAPKIQPSGPPPGFNIPFAGPTMRRLQGMELAMDGTTYFVITSMAVSPEHQGKGIGTKLLKYALKKTDEAGFPVFISAFPAPHNWYLKFGFEDIDHLDFDLSKAAKTPYEGFGIYRAFAMLRKPRK